MVKAAVTKFPVELVFAAACAAFRINNNQYTKLGDRNFDSEGNPVTVVTNRTIMQDMIDNPEKIQDQDREMGEKMRMHFKGMVFKVLAGEALHDIDLKGMTYSNEELTPAHNFGLIAYLPKKYETAVKKQTINDRVQDSRGGYIGNIGDKISRTVEILRTVYSQNWNCFFVTAVTEQDEAVFFSFKSRVDQGVKLNIRGTVKSHRDNQTQLNRVKVG